MEIHEVRSPVNRYRGIQQTKQGVHPEEISSNSHVMVLVLHNYQIIELIEVVRVSLSLMKI